MGLKQKALKRMETLGAYLSDRDEIINAPDNYVFANTDLHYTLVMTGERGGIDWEDLLAEMAGGVVPCENRNDCDSCRPVGEEG